MKKYIYLLFLLFPILQSCEKKHKYTIGFSQCTFETQWRKQMINEMNIELSFYKDIEFITRDADSDSKKQIEQIKELISLDVDILIVSPNETEPLTEIVVEAFRKGIPTIVLDRKIKSDEYTVFIGANNRDIGLTAGNYIVNNLNKKSRILEIWGQKGSSPAQDRHSGFHEAISKYDEIQVVAELFSDWSQASTRKLLNEIDTILDIDLVYSHNDEMALSSYNYLNDKGYDMDHIAFLGIDAIQGKDGGIRMVIEKKLAASFLYPTGGDVAIETAMKILNKEKVDQNIRLSTAIVDESNAVTLELQSNQINNYQNKIFRQQSNFKLISDKYNTQKILLYVINGSFIIILVLGVVVFKVYRVTKKKNSQLKEKNQQIEQQSVELEAQRDSIDEQNQKLTVVNKNQKVLADLGKQITSTLKIANLHEKVYEYLKSLADVNAFGIGLFNRQNHNIDYEFFIKDDKALPFHSKSIKDEYSLSVWCWKNQKPVFINDFSNENKNYFTDFPESRAKTMPRSIIHLPLTVEDKRLGLLVVNSDKKNAYSDEDFTNIQTVASYLSIALDNANAYQIIKNKSSNIMDSINYAVKIQNAMLPHKSMLDKHFESFILFRPRDIVSGDFYWLRDMPKVNGCKSIIIAAVDCTGHGVPGAFMSMVGNSLLNEIVGIRKEYNPSTILELLSDGINHALKQDESKNDDGMDVCLCRIEYGESESENVKVSFSGAQRPLFYYSSKEKSIITIKGSVKSIGGKYYKKMKFVDNELVLQKNDILYLTSDGMIDQCNPERKKLGTKRFLAALEAAIDYPLEKQKEILETTLQDYQQDTTQRDDITVMGLKL